jgi:hypothetical protein
MGLRLGSLHFRLLAHGDAMPAPALTKTMRIGDHGHEVILGILLGTRSHKDLKIAFDWESTPEGHAYWTRQRQAPGLSPEAYDRLARAICFDARHGSLRAA